MAVPLSSREAFLQRVREAVRQGNHTHGAPELPERGSLAYQGGGADPLARFRDMLAAAGGVLHVAADPAEAAQKVLAIVRERRATRVLLGRGDALDSLRLGKSLRAEGIAVGEADRLGEGGTEAAREALFAADVGISGVAALVAETGSVIVAAAPTEPRGLTLLPPVHVAVAAREQLLPDLFDLFPRLAPEGRAQDLPSCLVCITGPSKTGDIELRLVTGVHGPGEVHVVVVDGAASG